MNYSLLESRTFWTQAVQQAYNLLFPLLGVFPNVVWLTVTVNALGFILTTYFHVSGISNAAIASAKAGTPVSGQ
jgi:Na+-translocating ferredoxin:NAD+ oxidoreductase RnfE subunit